LKMETEKRREICGQLWVIRSKCADIGPDSPTAAVKCRPARPEETS
jgi:hypothetical protein